MTQQQLPSDLPLFEAKEAFGLRKLIGVMSMLTALPLGLLVFMMGTASALAWAQIIVALMTLGFLGFGCLAFFPRRAPLVRVRLTDDALWMVPDQNHWAQFAKPPDVAVEIPLTQITRIDDGGVYYSYRRLTVAWADEAVAVNTTHLDQDLRRITDAIAQAMKAKGLRLKEVIPVMAKRGGVWTVTPIDQEADV